MKTSQHGIMSIIADEGERLTAYFDIAGVATISVGVTDGVTDNDVIYKRTITKEESQAMFAMALAPRESAVERLCTLKPTQNQFDALVSLVYNIGEGAFAKSSVLKFHNAGNFQAASVAFGLWNKARIDGVLQPVRGLTDRRAREAELYSTPDKATAAAPIESMTPELKPSIMSFIMSVLKLLSRK
jgi:lysozyme